MNILSAQGLAKAYGPRQLFSDLTLGIEERDRIGVIGINGSGKSTMLRLITRLEEPDAGILAMRQDLRMEYLPQNPLFNEDHTVIEHIFSSPSDLASLVREYETVCRRLARPEHDPALPRRLDELSRRMEAAAAWEYETRARTILSKLGIEDLDARIGSLSGGYRKRVALAHALLAEPDLLVLDEPTNHLDADMVAWLEEYLRRFNGALLLVTHDRYFLDRVTRRIVEIDRGEVRLFEGNFSYYLERKAQVEAAFAQAENRRRAILKKELEWFSRGARARRTKEKARVQHIGELQSVSFTRPRAELRFEAATRRLGKKIVEINGISKALGGKKLIDHFSYTFARGERLGVIGPNACGKSTLANLIVGRLAPDSGSIEIGETIHFGYYDQESAGLDLGERAIDYVKREGGENLRTADGSVMSAAAVMERFLFTSQMLYAPVGKLSGGERRRLYLVRTLLLDPNFLILDEPANDLDITTLQALEDFLDGFGGCLIVISHDRYLLDRTVDKTLAFEADGSLRLYPGGYTVYAEMRAAASTARPEPGKTKTPAEKAAGKKPGSSEKSRKLTYKERLELAALEEEIPRLEERLQQIQSGLTSAAADYVKLKALSEEQAALTARAEAAMERWAELAARAL